MSTTIVMPKAGLTMVEGTISQWLVSEGAYVKKGDAQYLAANCYEIVIMCDLVLPDAVFALRKR